MRPVPGGQEVRGGVEGEAWSEIGARLPLQGRAQDLTCWGSTPAAFNNS